MSPKVHRENASICRHLQHREKGKRLLTIVLQPLAFFCIDTWWRRRESNSCPNIFFKSFLHAYFVLFPDSYRESGINWKQTTDQFLSCMCLLLPAQPMVTASCFVFDWAEELATGLPSRSAIMTT